MLRQRERGALLTFPLDGRLRKKKAPQPKALRPARLHDPKEAASSLLR
jgi:hypothetical protein